MIWYGMVWHGMAWHGMVWYGMAWYEQPPPCRVCRPPIPSPRSPARHRASYGWVRKRCQLQRPNATTARTQAHIAQPRNLRSARPRLGGAHSSGDNADTRAPHALLHMSPHFPSHPTPPVLPTRLSAAKVSYNVLTRAPPALRPWQSAAIRGNQWHSTVISGNHADLLSIRAREGELFLRNAFKTLCHRRFLPCAKGRSRSSRRHGKGGTERGHAKMT